jgi:hypothetical protein
MSRATIEMRLQYLATERGEQPAIDGATVHSVVLAQAIVFSAALAHRSGLIARRIDHLSNNVGDL